MARERSVKLRLDPIETAPSRQEGDPIVTKTLGVVGTPCGGTRWTSQRLRECGYEIAHERMGKDGISCGFYFFGSKRGYRFKHYDFEIVCQLIRHPLLVLQTLPRFAPHREATSRNPAPRVRIRPWMAGLPWEIGTDGRAYALRWWVHTHETVVPDLVVRVCHMDEDFPKLVEVLSESVGRAPREGPHKAKPRSKGRRWPQMSWDELHELDEEYAARAKVLVDHFGLQVR